MAEFDQVPISRVKVLVRCNTFNQADLIENALRGFVMQETDFPFVCLIMDDASTDGEQDVLRKYVAEECDPEATSHYETDLSYVTIARHKSNAYCTLAIYYLKQNLYGTGKKGIVNRPWREACTYEAMCEGDDYWTDPKKLQKQTDWLDNHKDYTMICSDARVATPSGDLDWHRYEQDCDIPVKDMILGGGLFVHTVTVFFRTEVRDAMTYDFIKKCSTGDYSLQLMSVIKGKVRYMAEKTAVYNYQTAGSWSSNEKVGNIYKLIRNWRSVVNMLDGFDGLTNGKYHKYFSERKQVFIKNKLERYPAHIEALTKEFDDVLSDVSLKIRLKYLIKNTPVGKMLKSLKKAIKNSLKK